MSENTIMLEILSTYFIWANIDNIALQCCLFIETIASLETKFYNPLTLLQKQPFPDVL